MLRMLSLWIVSSTLIACAVSEPKPSGHGGETNWLIVCEGNADCDQGSCLCGVCTTTCESSDDCAAGFEGSCVATESAPANALCRSAVEIPSSLCLPSCANDMTCGEGFDCLDSVCITVAGPGSLPDPDAGPDSLPDPDAGPDNLPDPDGGPPLLGDAMQDGGTFTAVLVNDIVLFEVSDREAIEIPYCRATRLEKKDAQGNISFLQNDRPSSSAGSPGYYLDGEYLGPTPQNNGCDQAGCEAPSSDRIEIGAAREYIKTGTRDAPADAPNAGEIIDVIETRPFSGDLVAHLVYSPPDQCDEREVVLAITVPEEGVCCPIEAEGCSIEGELGGWARSFDECGPLDSTFFDEAWFREDDVRGCPVLVYQEDVCCNCRDTDEALLLECRAPERCDKGFAQLIENSAQHIELAPVQCILEELSKAEAGRYVHETNSTFTNGAFGARHTLLVEFDSVLYTRVPYAYADDVTSGEMPEPAQRCALPDLSYFTDCLAALESDPNGAQAWSCVFGDGDATTPSRLGWLIACVDESPVVCE